MKFGKKQFFLENVCAHLVGENGRKINFPTAYANTRKKKNAHNLLFAS